SKEALNMAIEASEILFGKGTHESLSSLDERTLLALFEGVPTFDIDRNVLTEGTPLFELLAAHTSVFSSKGEARRMLLGGGISMNKVKLADPDMIVTIERLIRNRFLLIQKGKKQYYLIRVN
ncbi:MAG: tyrosine--tRNA ligase, partial [Bacteroidia bacterium]|nr:tyrosine--tRNA ligase [Bacteroidia bacterium]